MRDRQVPTGTPQGQFLLNKPVLDFMIVGAQKCGTTALSRFLSQHPDVCLSRVKETHLFDGPLLTGFASVDEVNALQRPFFDHYQSETVVGEATPIYLYWPRIAPLLARYNPRLKLIVLLRDPVDRAVSQHAMEKHRGGERRSLLAALVLEPLRLWWHRRDLSESSKLRVYSYVDRSRYSKQMKNLYKFFPKSQVLCLSSEQMKCQHVDTLRMVFRFLGVDENIAIPYAKVFGSATEHACSSPARAWLNLMLGEERRTLSRWLT